MVRAVGRLAAMLPLVSLACTTPIGDRASSDRPTPPDNQIPNDESFGLDAGRDASVPFFGDSGGPFSDSGFVDVGPLRDGALMPFGAFRVPPARFAVPPGGTPDGFCLTASSASDRRWLTIDLDGDRFSDLVQTSDPSAVGARVSVDALGPDWRVFRGSRAGFATTFTRFTVPASGLDDGFFTATGPGLARAWALPDLNGDARPDLVQTADPRFADGRVFRDAAGPFWRVFLAAAAGFATEARRLPVPESGLENGFSSVASAVDRRQWALVDVDGNGLLDLIQTANPARSGAYVFSDAAGVFWKRTRMVRASDAGAMATFASYTERFVVPPSSSPDGYFATSFGSAPIGARFWTTTDITGDGIADLVVSADPSCAGGYVWTDGLGAHWSFYRGVEGGFRLLEARAWVPPSGLGDGFFTLNEDGSRASRAWFVADLDGDGLLDLAQTADTASASLTAFRDVEGDHWRVYRVREGFSQHRPMRLGLPSSGADGGFFASNRSDPRGAWALLDLDGDGKHDLVQAADPALVGPRVLSDGRGAYWRV